MLAALTGGQGLEVGGVGPVVALVLLPHAEQVEGGVGADVLVLVRDGAADWNGLKELFG